MTTDQEETPRRIKVTAAVPLSQKEDCAAFCFGLEQIPSLSQVTCLILLWPWNFVEIVCTLFSLVTPTLRFHNKHVPITVHCGFLLSNGIHLSSLLEEFVRAEHSLRQLYL